jgi:hypothetical protein
VRFLIHRDKQPLGPVQGAAVIVAGIGSRLGGTVAETALAGRAGPGRLAAGSCGSGIRIRIGNPGRRRALVPPGQKRSGVFRRLVTRVWA